MVRREHTHTILTLLGLLALLLLAASVAGAGGWQDGDGVRYTTYRTAPPAYQPVMLGSPTVTTPSVWVTQQGQFSHLAVSLDAASPDTIGWIVAPLLPGIERPAPTAPRRKGHFEER